MTSSNFPLAVTPLLTALLPLIHSALPNNFVGACLIGSLALGDFDEETSDVDLIVVTERPVSEAAFAALGNVHDRIPPKNNEFGREYEVYYIDRETLRRWKPGQRHLRAEPTAPFHWETHRRNFVIERWVVRERGTALIGPDPKTLVDPISRDELRDAARSEIAIRLDDWAGGQPMPDWLGTPGAQGFEVETMCRALHTVTTGELCSKRRAIAWGLESLPARWHPLIEWAWLHHKDDSTKDTSRLEELVSFVRYAAERASMSAE